MVRSLATWTKTLSFPARISPNKHPKDNIIDVNHSISPTVTPTLSNNSLSKSHNNNNTEYVNNIMNNSPIPEMTKVSCCSFLIANLLTKYQ